MKRKPRISLPTKKPGKVAKLERQWRFAIGCFLLTLLVMWVWQELFTSVPLPRPLMIQRFTGLLARKCPPSKIPDCWLLPPAMQSKEKSKLVGHAMLGRRLVEQFMLTLSEIKRIIDLQLELRVRLSERHLDLELTEAAKEYIARQGYDPVYGARPLKRFLQRHLETVLSRQILAGTIPEN